MITANVLGQELRVYFEKVVSDSVKFRTVNFVCDEQWQGYSKKAVFEGKDKTVAVVLEEGNSLIIDENTCFVPFEVIKYPGFSLSLVGNKGDSVITSEPYFIPVTKSGGIDGALPEEPTPDQYAQIIDICTSAREIADTVKEELVYEKTEEIATVQGRIDVTTGEPSHNANSLYTDFMAVEGFKRFKITSGMRVRTYQYTADKTYISVAKYGENDMLYIDTKGEDIYKENYTFNEATAYIRLAIAYNPSATITPNDVSIILTSEVHVLKELQEEIDGNKAEIEAVKTDIEGVKTDVEAVKSDIEDIKANGEDLVGEKDEEIATVQGRIDATTGASSYNTVSLYTDFMTVESFKRFKITSGLRVRTYQYTADKTYIGIATYGENNMQYIDTKGEDIYKENYTFNEATAYIRLAIAYNPYATITPQDVSVILTSEVRALKKLQSGIDGNKAEIEQLKTAPCTREFLKEYINSVLCIGDSLTQGCYYNGGLQGHSSGKAIAENYPYFLSKMSNWSVKNAGVSGYSPVHWWDAYTHQDELTEEVLINKFKGLNFADYDFYIIWLGTNGNTFDGVTHGLTDTLETDVTPYSDYNDFADNGTGCYCKIISAIIEANPYARIVLGNVYVTVDVETTNTVINKIADLYSDNVLGVISMAEFKKSEDTLKYHPFYLDTDGNVVVGTDTGDDVRGNDTHLGKVGNLHLAKHFLDEITRLISENELKYYEYILLKS